MCKGSSMNRQVGQPLRSAGLNFFGAVVAGQSHELTNVLNIINELAGLQGDILVSVERGYPADTGKMKQIADRIRKQVERGETIVRCMNAFAHSADVPVTVFDLKETLERIMYLAQRPARLAKTLLDQKFPEESVSLETSPFGLKQVVFNCIEIALAASKETRRVTVSYQLDNKGAVVEIRSADPMFPRNNGTEEEGFLSLLLGEIGGELQATPDVGHPHRFLLSPRSRRLGRWSSQCAAERACASIQVGM